MNWHRWSAFFALAGLAAFLPAIFVPAMLVANALDGPRWYSVWSGIREFHRQGDFFLSALLFCFSLVFPALKFSLALLCIGGRRFLSPQARQRIVNLTSWTAKYSMLDVMVIAMLILLVKVNEYVRILPSPGLYLFSAAILLSALSSATLGRALKAEAAGRPAVAGGWFIRRPAWLLLLLGCTALSLLSLREITRRHGGVVDTVVLTRLTNRGELTRSVEKTLALKELMREEHDLFSRDTLKRLMEFGQAVTTDAGWKAPEARVSLETTDGRIIQSQPIAPVDLDARDLNLSFTLPEPVLRHDIAVLRLTSSIRVAKIIEAPIEEEMLRQEADPFRWMTRQWHGRVFSFELEQRGADGPGGGPLLWWLALAAGGGLGLWGLAALLVMGDPGRRGARPLPDTTPPEKKSTDS